MNLVPGQKLILKISDIAFGGEGVARVHLHDDETTSATPVEDFVVFVPFVLPAEEVEAEIVEVKKRFARARLVRVISPSPDRIEPRCRYFGECGGCQYQHAVYDTQLRLKHKQVSDLFERIGGFDAKLVTAVVPCPQPYGYRNRIMIRSQWDKFKQGLNIGYLRADSRLVVDIEECPIAEVALNEQIKNLRAHPPPKGGLKVVLRIQPEGWEVPPDSFFQNNFFLLPKLVEVVGDTLEKSGSRHLVDLYCGVGFFSVELADRVESYAGVEYDAAAIKAARRNAISRQRTNGEFVGGLAEELLPAQLETYSPEKTSVLLDPPRKGCAPGMLQLLRSAQPAQIIYVSCHPATMARDLNVLCADGVFELLQVVPLDMFPQTQHVECVADLRCKPRVPKTSQ